MDRFLISGAILLLILEVSVLLMGLDDAPSWMATRQQGSTKVIGQLSRTENQVRRRPRNSLVWNESHLRETVFEYDSVLTLAGSSAQIQLQGDTKLNLDENTLVVLEPAVQQDNASIRIRFSRGSVRSRNPDQSLSIETENFTLSAAKGAELSLVSLEDGRVSVELQGGTATLNGASGPQSILRGEKLILHEDKIEEKKSVSEQITWDDSMPARVYSHTFPVEFALKWRGQATSIRVINPAKKLNRLPLESEQSKYVNLEEGLSLFSLQDARGESPSFPVQVRRAPITRYLSPLPRDRARLGTEITFSWEALHTAESYRLEISRNESFWGDVQRIETTETQQKLKLKDEGAYYWRVIGFDAEKFQIPASQVYPLYLAPDPLASPQLLTPEIKAPEIRQPASREGASIFWKLLVPRAEAREQLDAHFSWTAIPGADHYVIEISRTPGFEEPVVNQRVTSAHFTWRAFARGVYFWRVAAGADGRLGLFSPLAVAKLENPGTFAGAGVTVKPVTPSPTPVASPTPTPPVEYKAHPDPMTEPPVELGVDTSGPVPQSTPIATTPTPPPTPTPEPEVVLSRDNGVSGRAIWHPQYRSNSSRSEEDIEGNFGGWVPLAFELELNFLSSANNLWEWRLAYDQTTWSPKESPRQKSLSDSRIQTDVYYRPHIGRWGYGLGAESISFFERQAAERGELKNYYIYGPSLRYSQTVQGTRELDFQLRVRFGNGIIGGRAQGALKFFVYDGKSVMIFIGPWGSFGTFKGPSGRSLRDLQIGGELGIGW